MPDDVCQQVRRHLSGYLDGELPLPQRHRVQQHVAGCPACRRIYDELSALDGHLRRVPTPPVPATLMQNIMAAVAAERAAADPLGAGDTPVWPSLWQAALAAGAPLVLGAAATVFHLGWDQASSLVEGRLTSLATGAADAGIGLWNGLVSTVTSWPAALTASAGSGVASGLTEWQSGVAWLLAHYVPALLAIVGVSVLTWRLLRLWGREVQAFAGE